jgi:hypothetical protein
MHVFIGWFSGEELKMAKKNNKKNNNASLCRA